MRSQRATTPHATRLAGGVVVNDVHSRLNATIVQRVEAPASVAELREAIRRARDDGLPICVTGGRHAMGAQQFATGAVMLDLRGIDRILGFDPVRGLVEVQAGMQWPGLISELRRLQPRGDGHGRSRRSRPAPTA